MAGTMNFAGAFMGTHVAETISKGIVNPDMIVGVHSIILAAVLAAIVWNFLTWFIGLPSSSSHALIGGLMGAGVVVGGWSSLEYSSILSKVIVPLFLSPIGGFIAGYIFMVLLAWVSLKMKFKTGNFVYKKLQIVAAAFMALTHGMNDAQKTMGIISLALLIFGEIPELYVPLWVKIACASAIMIGTLNGGWKIIKTMGNKIFKMRPVHGFASQSATAAVILGASLTGAPISTTQVISSSILGVGSSTRLSAVRWSVGKNMVVAWFLTIPAAGIVGAILMYLFLLVGI